MEPATPMADASDRTTCCVVGAGPAGVMLSLLLARAGIPVTLLEAHRDFDRDFRGDTIHPSTLEVLQQIGLADRLHHLPHVKAPSFRLVTSRGVQTGLEFHRLPTPFPYMMIMPQSRFLEFLTEEATRYPHFRILMGANAHRLLEERDTVRGVAYPHEDGESEIRALLTVAAEHSPWELELYMPERRVNHIVRAQEELKKKNLPVSYVLMTQPGRQLKGEVIDIHGAAEPNEQQGHMVRIRVKTEGDLGQSARPGASVKAHVNCGRTVLGWAKLHEAWEWLQANVFFM